LRIEHDYSLKTLGNIKSQIQTIFTYMEKEGMIASNPLKMIKFKNRVDVYKKNELSQAGMKKILENLYFYSPYFLYRFVYVMYYTGMTKQELVDLKHEHFDYGGRTINVIHPKAGYTRSIQIEDHVAEILKGQPKRNDYLLTNRLGRKIDPNHICRHLIRFRERYPDTPNFNMDSLRNAFAFHFLERGGSIEELTKMLGYSHRDHTVRQYGRPRRIFQSKAPATKEEIQAADWGIEVVN